MAVRFDNNNNSEWMQISFSPPQLKQFLEYKCHFIGFLLRLLLDLYRQSSAQNIKINEIANDLESGKIVGKKIISDALLSVVSCCFMDDKNLKDLKKLLSQDQISLSNAITMTINNANAFEINEINLTSAIIDKIEYHFRDNTFHFIFNISNNFLSGKSRLTIEVPRVELENIKLPDMKEIYVNQWYINIFINTLIFSINESSYTLTGA